MASIQIRGDLKPVSSALERIAAIGRSPARVLAAIGLELEDNTRRRFTTNVAPDGSPWAPLNPIYAQTRKGPLPILVQSGALRRRLVSEVRGHTIVVGSDLVYAKTHQFGATIVPKQARALQFRMGDKLVHARRVTIPARPFLGFGPEDKIAVVEQLETALHLALRAR